jgi:hypothetical protein
MFKKLYKKLTNYQTVAKWHFSNLTLLNRQIEFFSSNMTVMTNRVTKLQLFNNLKSYFIIFEHYGTKIKMTDSLGI